MKSWVRDLILGNPMLASLWGNYRGRHLIREYRQRREAYAQVAEQTGLKYAAADTINAVRSRITQRGYSVAPRAYGDIHTFTFVPRIFWHSDLIHDLHELGPVTEFDYAALGHTQADLFDPAIRRAVNEKVLPALRAAHARRPVDWVFVYANGLEIEAETIAGIRDELGIPVVNLCLDDKQSWAGPYIGKQRRGQVDILREFDISWTSARVACEWYLVEGGRPLYMPEGFAVASYHPLYVEQDIPASFVGAAYGFRPQVVRHLRGRGIPIHTFGSGWADSGWVQSTNEIFNRSVVNLGMGGIGYTTEITNVKGRDFEIPGAGGGVYLTSYNSDLAQHYLIGEEILCYRDRDEMVELLRYYLKRPEEARGIARNAFARCLREHRWLHRYYVICRALGILDENLPSARTSAAVEIAGVS
jgi:spore maturation protein CgeB